VCGRRRRRIENPEQPPPFTLMRSMDPAGSPAMISLIRLAARSVKLMPSMIALLPYRLPER
jgi:hypothetical protein